MKAKQLLGLIGSIVLLIGVFTPIVSVPIMGNMNYFQNGEGDGTIILILAVISLVLVLVKKYKGLWFTGIGSLAVMLITFINFQSKMSQAKADMESELAGNPFRGLADMAMQSVQLQWGWALLIVGVAMIIASAAVKDESQEEKKTIALEKPAMSLENESSLSHADSRKESPAFYKHKNVTIKHNYITYWVGSRSFDSAKEAENFIDCTV